MDSPKPRRAAEEDPTGGRTSDGAGGTEDDKFKFIIPFKRGGKWRSKSSLNPSPTLSEEDHDFLLRGDPKQRRTFEKKFGSQIYGKRNSLLRELSELKAGNDSESTIRPSSLPRSTKPGGQKRPGLLTRRMTDLPSSLRSRSGRSSSELISSIASSGSASPSSPRSRSPRSPGSPSSPREAQRLDAVSSSPLSPRARHDESLRAGSRSGHHRAGSMIVFGSGSVPYNSAAGHGIPGTAHKKRHERRGASVGQDGMERWYYEFLSSSLTSPQGSPEQENEAEEEGKSAEGRKREKSSDGHRQKGEGREKNDRAGRKGRNPDNTQTKKQREQLNEQVVADPKQQAGGREDSSPSKTERRRQEGRTKSQTGRRTDPMANRPLS